MKHRKRIYRWECGNNPKKPVYATRGFIICGHYGDSFEVYQKLVRIAKKDFPFLKAEDITVGRIRNSRYMDEHSVISFLLPNNTTHKSYDSYDTPMDFGY